MELTKTAHDSGLGIYAKAVKTSWTTALKIGREMVAFLDANNGRFLGEHSSAFALAHCQVAPVEKPLNLLVVTEELTHTTTGRMNRVNTYFPSRIIYNLKILKKPDSISIPFPVKVKTGEKDGKATFELRDKKREVSNKRWFEEGCMSFPHLRSRKMERHFRIRVRYWYINRFGIPWRKTEWVEGLKSHIFQHEMDHFNAYPIYHRDKLPKNV